VNTVTAIVPATAISVAATVAVNCVGLIKVVVSKAPFHLTTEPFTKLLPFTVNVKAAPPAMAVFGLMEAVTGTGLLTTTLLMVKVRELLVPPPGVVVNTETSAVPAIAILAAGTIAVS